MDREKVIKGLECCSVPQGHCEKCPYETEGFVAECTSELAKDALELLKKQEAVKPIKQIEQNEWTVCGNCRNHIISKWIVCPYCGRSVKWE